MAKDLICPICSSDVPLGGDERKGDEIHCPVCSAPLKLKANYGDDDIEAEEDM